MKKLPKTKHTLLLRTDFKSDEAWEALVTAIQAPVASGDPREDGFRAYVTPLSDKQYAGATPKQLASLAKPHHTFLLVADRKALTDKERPFLVVDAFDKPGRTLRSIPSYAWAVENNLSVANIDFDDLKGSADDDGVVRDHEPTRAKAPANNAATRKASPKNTLSSAQATALRGQTDAAVAQLASLQAAGDVLAAAALQAVYAYRGEWNHVLKLAAAILAKPGDLPTHNTYVDTIQLAALAARELGAWTEAKKLAALATKALSKGERDQARRVMATKLTTYVAEKGAVPLPGAEPGSTPAAAAKSWAGSKDKLAAMKFKTPKKRFDHYMAVSRVYEHFPGAVELFDAQQLVPGMFDVTLFLVSALARAKRADDAWKVLRAQFHTFWPATTCEVAPVALLTDEALRELLTAPRREELLAIPRGDQA